MKQIFSERVPQYADSFISRWLSDEPLFASKNGEESSIDRAILAIGKAVREFVKNDLIPDIKEMRNKKMISSVVGSNRTIASAIARVRDTARDYVIEAISRLRERTWTSCLVSYMQSMPAKLAAKLGEREDLREIRERLQNAVARVRAYFDGMKERYMSASATKPLMQGLKDAIANAEINVQEGEIDAKIPLSRNPYRSLRTPAALASKVEHVRDILERGVAAVRARLANPSFGVTLRRVYGMMQYFRAAELKYLLL
jgi:hypothetical protein